MARSPFVSILGFEIHWRARQPSISYSHMLPIWERLHGERQILPIARTPLTPTSLSFLPRCIPVWVRLPSSLLLLLPLHREGIYILIGRAAHRLRMRVCVQANSRKRTQLHKFPMNPPDNSWARENDIFSHWASLSAAYGSIYINISKYTHAYFTKQTRSLKWDLIWCHVTSGVIRWDGEVAFDLQSSLSYWECIEMANEQSGGSSRKKAWLRAGVITEHDGSITAVIRHQTKGTSRAGRRGRSRERGEDGPRHSCSIIWPLDEVSAWSTGREVNTSAAPEEL